MDQQKIGKFIAQIRKEKNITQVELAEKLHVSNKSISRWETGKCMPDISLFNPICNALDITVNELLNGERLTEKEYSKKLEKSINTTINYTSNLIKKRNLISNIYVILLGVILLMTAMFLYPSEVEPRPFYLVIITFILTMIYFAIITKLTDINASQKYYVIFTTAYLILFNISLLFVDYINLKINNIPPRFSTPTVTILEDNIYETKYDTIFYSVYRCKDDSQYKITLNKKKSITELCN